MNNYLKAIKLMVKAHWGQKDKGGKPYVFHPIAVCRGTRTKDAKIVALLHDVLEDSNLTLKEMTFLNENQKEALNLLNHDKNIPYMEYIEAISQNPLAREVKISDLKHNLNLKRLKVISIKDQQRYAKYNEALKLLKKINC